MLSYLLAFCLDLAIELPVAWLLKLRSRPELWAVFLVNLFSFPLLQLVLLVNSIYALFPVNWLNILIMEILVWLSEGLLLRLALGLSYKRALMISLAMNSASFLLGLILLPLNQLVSIK